jgi:hypothetical protein
MTDDSRPSVEGNRGHPYARANARRLWSGNDDAQLRRLIAGREPPAAIARCMQRTQDAIRGRAGQLGLAVPSPLRPWRRHWGRALREERDKDIVQQIHRSGDPASANGR